MEITVSSRHTEVSEVLRQATMEKIGRLSRYLEGMDRAEVHFSQHRSSRNPDREVCEVTMQGHGHHVRCKVSAPDGFAAVDLAIAKLEHQLHKLKTKLQRKEKRRGRPARGAVVASAGRTPGGAAPARDVLGGVARSDGSAASAGLAGTGDEDDEEDDARPRIVKTKAFTIKPMTPEEAVLQMELLGHDFFFFTNADTERAAVVYRRDDGDVGLIDEA